MNLINHTYLQHYQHVISKEFCDILINVFDDSKDVEKIDNEYMKFDMVNLSNHYEDIGRQVACVMFDLYEKYKYDCKLFDFQIPQSIGYEGIRIKKYYPNIDDFKPHVDAIDKDSSKRFLSFLFYLNDVEVGGETQFIYDKSNGFSIRPTVGSVVMFPPTWNYPHLAKAPISGEKYIISSYLNFA